MMGVVFGLRVLALLIGGLLTLEGCGAGTSGAGTAPAGSPAIKLSTTAISFADQTVGTASGLQTVSVTNSGTAAVVLNSITVTGIGAGSFVETNTCGSSLAVGSSCIVSVSFTPIVAGSATALLSVSDNVTGSPQTVTLSGVGTTVTITSVSLSANALAFSQIIGTSVSAQTVTVTNTGNTVLSLGGVALSGANASNFTESTTCGATLVVGANCTISVGFSASVQGSYAAVLAVSDNASGSPQTVALTGVATGVPAISLSASTLTFSTDAESTSSAQTVTVSNSGNALLTISGITLTGTNAVNFAQTNTCGTSLAVNASCTITVTFTPSLAAAFSASLSVASNASTSPATVLLSGTGTGALTIDTSNANDWKISNAALTLDWNSHTGHVFGAHLTGYADNLVDTTTTSGGQPDGLYMDNTGQGAGTVTSGYSQQGNEYIDWWITTASSSTNPFTYTQHFILTANDTGFHVYSTVAHSAQDIAGSIGQWQYVFRINLSLFTETYGVNTSLGNLGVMDVPLPDPAVYNTTDPGRQVQNAVVDLHGLQVPAGFTRSFFTKYDYQSQEYLHAEHGVYGSKYGAWLVLPSSESLVGGPTKQDLIFTENILMMEALSGHLVNSLVYTPSQGVATSRLFGPYYFHFNAFTATSVTPAALYQEATTYLPSFPFLYDSDSTLVASGYVASNARGTVAASIAGGAESSTNTAWAVLSDDATNFQYSNAGRQYWVNNNAAGNAPIGGVVPGTYRLSAYVLGQWGELRVNHVTVTANATTTLAGLKFTPENFGTAAPIFTIGTPDRSAHEFLHGHDASGNDLRNFWGANNFWQDFASTSGAQIYYATAVGSTPATNDLSKINYVQWQTFNPGLFGGVYNAADDTTDGYKYIAPAYVTSPSTMQTPGTTIHFTATSAQLAQGQYAVLSMGVASAEASITMSLNGHNLVWHYINASDAMVRSGLSGYYQWIAFQWPTSYLNAAGADNTLTYTVSQPEGVMPDAFRFEITNTSADPAITGWNDYEYLYGTTYKGANDAAANN